MRCLQQFVTGFPNVMSAIHDTLYIKLPIHCLYEMSRSWSVTFSVRKCSRLNFEEFLGGPSVPVYFLQPDAIPDKTSCCEQASYITTQLVGCQLKIKESEHLMQLLTATILLSWINKKLINHIFCGTPNV